MTGLRDGSPDSGEIVKSQYIYVAPIATLTTEPQYDWEARETVTFRTEDLKGDPSTDYTRYWVFGDGATDDTNDYPVEHRYDLVGTYDVQCTVSRDGQSHTSTTQVTIDWMKPAQQTLSPANDGGTIYTTIQGIDVCAVDLNGIAPLDVVGTFSLERHVFVWMDGAYGASSYEIGYLDNWPSAVACGDIDGDGHNDIVAGCSTGELQWCENTLPATAWTYHYINAQIDVEDTTGLNGIYLSTCCAPSTTMTR